MSELAIAVMAKFPTPGRVKTRLGPALDAAQAAQVQQIFLEHCVRRMREAELGDVWVVFDPPDAEGGMREILEGSPEPGRDPAGLRFMAQCPGDLGARLAAAARGLFGLYEGVLFFGVDSPDLPAGHLREAAGLMGSADAVLGPSEDGGYWCIGVRKGVDVGALLTGVPWSSGKEFAATRDRALAMGLALSLAPRWDDVDRPDDLKALGARLLRSQAMDDILLERALRLALGPGFGV